MPTHPEPPQPPGPGDRHRPANPPRPGDRHCPATPPRPGDRHRPANPPGPGDRHRPANPPRPGDRHRPGGALRLDRLSRLRSLLRLRSLGGRILLSQMGVLLLVLAAANVFTLWTLEHTYLQERRIHYLTQANVVASTGGPYLAGKEPYLRYVAREFGTRAGARVLFLDAAATVVVDSYGDPALEGRVLPAAEVKEALAGRQTAALHRFPDLGWVMYTAVPVPAPGASRTVQGAVFLSASLASVQQGLRAFALRMLLLSLAALGLGAGASFLLAGVITRPLARLRRAVQQLATGHWHHRVGMRGHDEIARLGQAFDRMAEDLRRLDQTRRDFVADASHELRTPLAALRALLEPMAQSPPLAPATYRELAGEALAQTERMQNLAEALLELARLDNQLETGAALQRVPTDLVQLAREAVEYLAPLAWGREPQPTQPALLGTPPAEPGSLGLPPAEPGSLGLPPAEPGTLGPPPAQPGPLGPPPAQPGPLGPPTAQVEPEPEPARLEPASGPPAEVRMAVEATLHSLTVPIDPDMIHRVLTNLLDNAIKHTPAGGKVIVRVRREGDRGILEVADTGEGIPAEHLPFLFQRFHRVDPARARRTGGTGLGLAIADRLVRLHGGEISVNSKPGEGTTFTISLPMCSPDAALPPPPGSATKA